MFVYRGSVHLVTPVCQQSCKGGKLKAYTATLVLYDTAPFWRGFYTQVDSCFHEFAVGLDRRAAPLPPDRRAFHTLTHVRLPAGSVPHRLSLCSEGARTALRQHT